MAIFAAMGSLCRVTEALGSGTVIDNSDSISSVGQSFTECSAVTGSPPTPLGQPVTTLTVGRGRLILGPNGYTDADS